MKIILLGPPGAGKGTISDVLINEFNLYHLSIGEIFREQVAKKTILGKDIKKYIEKGKLVPSNIATEIVKLDLGRRRKYILDGFPRDLNQADSINQLKVQLVLYLDVSLKQVVERLSGRRVCSKCRESFHIKYIKPKISGKCDHCSGKLIRRKDDSPSSIKKRFEVYLNETTPLINYYKNKNILKTIDASQQPNKVKKDTIKLVRKYFNK